ncbi:MAG: hypothetical protein V1681_10835 [Candidatus Neomarinimicrobiota bacterium]
MMIKRLAIFIFVPLILLADESQLAVNGYLKTLFFTEKYEGQSDWFVDNLLHGRLNLQYYASQSLTGAIAFRFRQYAGKSVENGNITSDQIMTPQDILDLDRLFYDKNSVIGYGEIDRLWIDWTAAKFQATVGRQRIAWGTSWVWNPTDLFNPASVLDFDYEEQPAIDGLRLQYYTGALSKMEFAVKPDKKLDRTIAAGLLKFNFRNYDFNLLAGVRNFRWVAGLSWAGDIYKAGFRGEITASRNWRSSESSDYNAKWQSVFPIDIYRKMEMTAVLSADYTFRNSFYTHTELFQNTNGFTHNLGMLQIQTRELGLPTLARWSLFQEFAYDLTPLIRVSLFGIYNPDDQSVIVLPSVTYSAATNLDLMLLGVVNDGRQLTEFGDYYNAAVFRIKWSF